MKRLLKNGTIVNVFTDTLEKADVLIDGDRIIGVDSYDDKDADIVEDVSGKYICPGFIDGHIHIESSMLQPAEFARACIGHGTTCVIADPHEIANVSGIAGIMYMLEASENIPMSVYIMVPSCVPATPFDEAGAVLTADEIETLFSHPRVLGLGEMMNYPGVLFDDDTVLEKIKATKRAGLIINGHAPLLSGKSLDKYISSGIFDDHECSDANEAIEKLKKGQWVMIRQGTAARNLKGLLPLFDEPYSRRCMLVTDDKHPADLIKRGHIDSIIREAVCCGKSPLTGIRMATLQAAEHFGLKNIGAIAPGYTADVLILDKLNEVTVRDVYKNGEKVVDNGVPLNFESPCVSESVWKSVINSFSLSQLSENDFEITPNGKRCRVIKLVPDQLITQEEIRDINFSNNNGVSIEQDILKLAVIERHKNTGHIGLGFVSGMGLKSGAIASSVSHDSHNLIVVGTNNKDMAIAANRINESGGGIIVVKDSQILAQMPLPIGGLMGMESAAVMAQQNEEIREQVKSLGVPEKTEPFMSMSFISLPVIPSIKMTTKGLVDVNKFEIVSLFED